MKHHTRYISDKNKQIILKRQKYRCANSPGANLFRIGDWPCLLWEGNRNGVFMDNMYEFDHVVEFSLTKDNNIDNISAICALCHSYKTKNFQSEMALARKKGVIDDYDAVPDDRRNNNSDVDENTQVSTKINKIKKSTTPNKNTAANHIRFFGMSGIDLQKINDENADGYCGIR